MARTETSSQRFGTFTLAVRRDFVKISITMAAANGAISWVDRNRDVLAALVLKEDSWNLLPQESGELQRWIRNVGQVLLSICQEKFSLGICGSVEWKSGTSWRREVQRVTRWLRYVTENQIVCSSSLEETVNSDTWWSMQKKAGVERWCAKGLLLK